MISYKPKLLIDASIVSKNINHFVDKTNKNKIAFTPHFKTHQSKLIGEIFKTFGIHSIKVSSISMANYFMENGWQSITLAFPAHPGMLEEINLLADRCDFTVFVNNKKMARTLAQNIQHDLSFYIEIDTGSGRSGVHWKDLDRIDAILEVFKGLNTIKFKGFYTHTGDSYQSKNKSQIQSCHDITEHAFKSLSDCYAERFSHLKFCSGDTPTASVVEDFGIVNQISAGNFVYYDVMQALMGSCGYNDIAVALAVPVAEIDRPQNKIIVHGGAVHLSKDAVKHPQYGLIYGLPVPLNISGEGEICGWGEPLSDSYVLALSQEHGTIFLANEHLDSIQEGDVIGIMPVHSCLTANLMKGSEQFLNVQNQRA